MEWNKNLYLMLASSPGHSEWPGDEASIKCMHHVHKINCTVVLATS